MLFDVELDLTPEGAESMREFDELFNGGLFYLLASTGKMGRTDISTLLRVSNELVTRANHCGLCDAPNPVELQDRIDQIRVVFAQSEEIKAGLIAAIMAWYETQPDTTQAAIVALFESLKGWLAMKAATMTPEAQEVVNALLDLLACLHPPQRTMRLASVDSYGGVVG